MGNERLVGLGRRALMPTVDTSSGIHDRLSWARETAATGGDVWRLMAGRVAAKALVKLPGRGLPWVAARRVDMRLRLHGRTLRIRHRLDWGDVTNLWSIFRADMYRLPLFERGHAPVVVDVGANIGLFTLFFSTLLSGARFVCIEPDPDNLELLAYNLAANGIDALIMPAAVGPVRGTLPLYRYRNADAHSLTERPGLPVHGVVPVCAAPLGDLLDRVGVADIDVLKVDIEGGEAGLCADAECWAPRVRGALFVDIHEDLVDRDAVLADLWTAGFEGAPETWVPGARGFVRRDLYGPSSRRYAGA